MHNAWPWRYNQHVLKGLSSPLEKNEAFKITLKLKLLVLLEGIGPASKYKKIKLQPTNDIKAKSSLLYTSINKQKYNIKENHLLIIHN